MSDAAPKDLNTTSGSIWAWIYAPDGRMGRFDYFCAVFVRALVIALPVGFFGEIIVSSGDEVARIVTAGAPVWTIAVLLTAGGPTIRRLHDLGLSGLHAPWLGLSLILGCALFYQLPRPVAPASAAFYLLAWVPYLLVLALMLWPGTKGPNRFGPPAA